jgi:adenylyltransferase/sulfurtransferase
VGVIASIQAIEAIKILSGNVDCISTDLTVVELWANRIRRIDLRSLRDRVDCPTCKRREFPSLAGAE